uniref:Uncharacterized protein n=1 Tax=candidate division WWE3 bacterium TaxID=2053526 RepID=A0A7C4TJW0_UNCKA
MQLVTNRISRSRLYQANRSGVTGVSRDNRGDSFPNRPLHLGFIIFKPLRLLVNITKQTESKTRLIFGLVTSTLFGLIHMTNYTNPIAAIPLCLTQTFGGLTHWYLQERYFVSISIVTHMVFNLILWL